MSAHTKGQLLRDVISRPDAHERPIPFIGPMVRAILDGRKTQTRRVMRTQPDFDSARRALGGDTSGATVVVEQNCAPALGCVGLRRGSGVGYVTPNIRCPFGLPGDRLWVRETWRLTFDIDGTEVVEYRAGGTRVLVDGRAAHGMHRTTSVLAKWRPWIFLRREHSRLTLEITDVRVERVQEISEEDAQAEGFEAVPALAWWQGYRDFGTGVLSHQQARGTEPPDWMIEPKPMVAYDPRATTAAKEFQFAWDEINGKRAPWAANPWVWVISFRRAQP